MKYQESIQVGSMQLENRFVQPPMATEKSDAGNVSDAICDYYKERSGSIALIITEHAYITKQGQASKGQMRVDEQADLDGLKKLVDTVHAQGTTKICAQINHAGMKAKEEVTGMPVIDINTLNQEEMDGIKEAFVKAALLVKEAGFDAVEVHGAHGYLLNQFYSPLKNHRTDAYTGSTLEGRTKFACEVLRAVRQAVGENYPILYRFGAADYEEGGATEEEAGMAAEAFVKAGADCLDISGGINGFIIRGFDEPGWFSRVGKKIKEHVSVPVLVTGGITTREQAEEILEGERADLIGVGRPILTNPDWAKEALSK